jgi:hypothetical protein
MSKDTMRRNRMTSKPLSAHDSKLPADGCVCLRQRIERDGVSFRFQYSQSPQTWSALESLRIQSPSRMHPGSPNRNSPRDRAGDSYWFETCIQRKEMWKCKTKSKGEISNSCIFGSVWPTNCNGWTISSLEVLNSVCPRGGDETGVHKASPTNFIHSELCWKSVRPWTKMKYGKLRECLVCAHYLIGEDWHWTTNMCNLFNGSTDDRQQSRTVSSHK